MHSQLSTKPQNNSHVRETQRTGKPARLLAGQPAGISFQRAAAMAALGLLTLAGTLAHAAALGTAFTYQGRLSTAGATVTGYYDFSFAIFDAATAGTQRGTTVSLLAVPVNDGLFKVTLDAGNVFDGTARWLAIAVKTNTAASFTVLTPRQPITPAPYSIYAPAAGSASVAYAVASGCVTGAGLAAGSVASANLAGGAVGTAALADNSITSAKLASDAASLAKVSGGRLLDVGNNVAVQGTGAEIDTSLFTGMGLQYSVATGEGAIMTAYNAMDTGHGFLGFYTKDLHQPLSRRMVVGYNGHVGIGTATNNPYAVLQVDGTNLMTASADGLLNVGPVSGYHLTLDGDDLQAKSGANPTGLYLNYWGGNTFIGYNGTVLQVQGNGVGINGDAGDSALNVQGQARLNDFDLVLRSKATLTMAWAIGSTSMGPRVTMWMGPFSTGITAARWGSRARKRSP